jgi:hypothetical protein
MFFPGSRYVNQTPYSFTLPSGTIVQAITPPAPGVAAVLGYYRRQTGNRLDQIAGRFLSDATKFWHVCDANNAMVPDALAARDLIGIPLDAAAAG